MHTGDGRLTSHRARILHAEAYESYKANHPMRQVRDDNVASSGCCALLPFGAVASPQERRGKKEKER